MKDFNELDEELKSEMPELKSIISIQSEFIADIVFSLRVKQGLTQQQLADKAGVIIQDIHRIEGGSFKVADSIYSKALAALNNMSEEEYDSFIDQWNSIGNISCIYPIEKTGEYFQSLKDKESN